MWRSNGHRQNPDAAAGFTLLELLVAMAISMIIFLAVIGAFIFLGRSLARLSNTQKTEIAGRRAIYLFTKDVSAARQVTTAAKTQLVLTFASGKVVTYNWGAVITDGVSNGFLTRTAVPANAPEDSPTTILGRNSSDSNTANAENVKDVTFNYYGTSGGVVGMSLGTSANGSAVKAISFSFTVATGSTSDRVDSQYTTVSPCVILRNKPSLE